ncbi:MAG TPA: polyphosphate polymerase domain-containing protein [Cellvibrionaceae bacterium]
MSTTNPINLPIIERFSSIGLDELNAKAAMLTRLDNKYIATLDVVTKALYQWEKMYDVLQINNRRAFAYETCYFDDAELSSYYDHHRGRRQRLKVRTRNYLDSQQCFLEIKLKDIRGVTVKKRMAYHPDHHGNITPQGLQFVTDVQQEKYNKQILKDLSPTLHMRYQRMTFVAKEGSERLTLDSNLVFYKDGKSYPLPSNLFIVETKSANANGKADAILRRLHQHPSNKCSKYCLGLCVTNQVEKRNKFLPSLRRLGIHPPWVPERALQKELPPAELWEFGSYEFAN